MKKITCPSCHGEGKKYTRGNHSSITTNQWRCGRCLGEGEISIEDESVTETNQTKVTKDSIVSKKCRIMLYILLLLDIMIGYFAKDLTGIVPKNTLLVILFLLYIPTIIFWVLGIEEAVKEREIRELQKQYKIKSDAVTRFNRLPL